MYIQGSTADIGGVFYINQPMINIYLKNVRIMEPEATTMAGIVFIQRGNIFSIENSEIKDF